MKAIIVVGIGPGSIEDMTAAVRDTLRTADIVIGYKYYFQFISYFISSHTKCIDTGMKKERERAEKAFEMAEQGHQVVVISSGDAGIYGMASLLYEMKYQRGSDIDIIVHPGISAFQKAASLLGAPISHDFCVLSLSDLMTPWALIERRIKAAAEADFVTAVYNPRSNERYCQLDRMREIFLNEGHHPDTPVGYVRQAGRDGETVKITTLAALDTKDIDMLTVIIIGNSQTTAPQCIDRTNKRVMITPRGYYANDNHHDESLGGTGAAIMTQSFRTILSEMKNPDIPTDKRWLMLHAIHTTADFDMEDILHIDDEAPERIFKNITKGKLKTIVTDVTMVVSGIRKAALSRLGIEAKCYLHDPRVAEMSEKYGITRTQAGIRLGVEEHPDALFVFGNAPTALLELCELMRHGKAHPVGVIAAPVGFVHVKESKYAVKSFSDVPKIIVEGRKGGSNIAATLCNAIMTLDDAEQIKPGRDF